jgi:hypothetical protein
MAVDVIGDAGRFYVLVQTLIETMMKGTSCSLPPFSCKRGHLKKGKFTYAKALRSAVERFGSAERAKSAFSNSLIGVPSVIAG